jgi:hypothetical protein
VNATETARLCRIITSLAPQQKFDDDTPAVWHAVLVDVNVADALEAVKILARTRPFIGTSEICEQVRLIRKARTEEAAGVVPNVDPDDIPAFLAEQRAIFGAAADGTLDPQRYAEGGWTLSGAAPRIARKALGDGQPERLLTMIETGVQLPRVPIKDVVRERNAVEQAAHERAKAEQLAGLQKLIDAEPEAETA